MTLTTNISPVPDFRSDTGLFRSLRKEHKLKSSGKDLFDASVYKDADSTAQFHDMVRNMANDTQKCNPTPFHHLLATLADQGRLLRLYTQNIDSLDTQLPPLATQVPLERKGPWPKAIQVHGNLQKMVCIKCRKVSDLEPEIFNGPTPPECENCVEVDRLHTEVAGKRSRGVGWLRPRMVLYNESNPDEEAIGAVMAADLHKRPDALIVVGTTLQIPGMKRLVREMCSVIRGRREGMTVWLNRDPPPAVKDYEWDLIVKSNCDEIAKRVEMKKWNEMDDIPIYGQEDDPKAKDRRSPEIVIQSPSKVAAARAQSQISESSYHFEPTRNLSPKKGKNQLIGIPTPVASPRIAPLQLGQKKTNAAPAATVAAKAGRKAGAKAVSTTQPKKAPAKKTTTRKSTTTKVKAKPNGMITFSIAKSTESTEEKGAKKAKAPNSKPTGPAKMTSAQAVVSTPAQKSQQHPTNAILQEALELLSSPESNASPTAPRTPSKAMQPVTPSEGRLNGGSRSPARPPHSPIPENYRSDGEYWGIENIPKPVHPPADPYRSCFPTDGVPPEICRFVAKSHSPQMRALSRSSTLEIDLKTSPEHKHWSSSSTIQFLPDIKIPKKYDFAHKGAYVGESKEQRKRTVSPTSVPGSMQKLLN